MKNLFLYIPFVLALAFEDNYEISYWISWLGSIVILIMSMSGFIKPVPNDLPIKKQIVRPLFLVQLIFIGYMALTSFFYYFDSLGYFFFEYSEFSKESDSYLQLLSETQRIYVLAHAGYVHGLLLFMKYPKNPKYIFNPNKNLGKALLSTAIVFGIFAFTFKYIPGLDQFAVKFGGLAFVAITLLLVFSITQKGYKQYLIISALIFTYNLSIAIVSGWKEEIIVPFIILGVFLYPYYQKSVIIGGLIVGYFFLAFVPVYNHQLRSLVWEDGYDRESAAEIAIRNIENELVDKDKIQWEFLTSRLSEMSMFTKYLTYVEEYEKYGFQIIEQGLLSIPPRIIFRNKPNIEELVHQRVLAAEVTADWSKVSAKPALVADGYLSFGYAGSWAFLFFLGVLISKISFTSENLFGGYFLGTCLIFTGLFQIFWRGNCFEFVANAIFWSYVTMYLVHYLAIKYNLIVPNRK